MPLCGTFATVTPSTCVGARDPRALRKSMIASGMAPSAVAAIAMNKGSGVRTSRMAVPPSSRDAREAPVASHLLRGSFRVEVAVVVRLGAVVLLIQLAEVAPDEDLDEIRVVHLARGLAQHRFALL